MYAPSYYALYEGGRPKETEAFKPRTAERYQLKGVDFKGVDKPIEWEKLVDGSGETITARGDMGDILSIMYDACGDKTYPFDDFQIICMDGEYYVYTRTYVSVHSIYRYDREAKKPELLGELDDVHIMRLIGLAGPES